ncbi:MAG: hypothetical protein SAK29_05715 [Scytonema sp. PMC 1069.18]|nr:hypothetical protein [Scytonema sp. PMC 1069.18]MEC4884702.1 hypothetical protein [Scytonema sp. PMC 1070.18]
MLHHTYAIAPVFFSSLKTIQSDYREENSFCDFNLRILAPDRLDL